MADEITMNAFYSVTNGGIDHRRTVPTTRFNQSTSGKTSNTVTVPNDADLELDMGGVTAPGLAFFQNLADPATDSTHIVNIGPDDTGMVPAIRLAPGQWTPVFLAAAPYARAAAGAPKLYYEIFER